MITSTQCSIATIFNPDKNCSSDIYIKDTYTFEKDICKINNIYYGKITNWTKEKITVEKDNGETINFIIKPL